MFLAVRESLREGNGHHCQIRNPPAESSGDIFIDEALKMTEENPGVEE
jgi:hypothetical protein